MTFHDFPLNFLSFKSVTILGVFPLPDPPRVLHYISIYLKLQRDFFFFFCTLGERFNILWNIKTHILYHKTVLLKWILLYLGRCVTITMTSIAGSAAGSFSFIPVKHVASLQNPHDEASERAARSGPWDSTLVINSREAVSESEKHKHIPQMMSSFMVSLSSHRFHIQGFHQPHSNTWFWHMQVPLNITLSLQQFT